MRTLKAKINLENIFTKNFKNFHFNHKEVEVQFLNEKQFLIINLKTVKKSEFIKKTFFEIYDYLFLLFGYFPKLESLYINNKNIKLDDIANKYKTSQNFKHNDFLFVNFSSETVNSQNLTNFKQINMQTIHALQYILSSAYENVVLFHRLTLLLHVADGLVDNDLENEIKKNRKTNDARRVSFKEKISEVFKPFLNYNKEYNYEILKILNVTTDEFLQSVTNTRNSFSHFLLSKELIISNGTNQAIYFEFIYYSIRLFIFKYYLKFDMEFNIHIINQYYFSIYDWICELMGYNNKKKSNLYKVRDKISRKNKSNI